jgi:exodeoxyribonuclease VII small subunit
MSKPSKIQPPASFETALSELEGIVAGMEAGQMSLEQTLAAYKQGTALLQFCQKTLQEAQQQVRILEGNTLQNFPSADDDN